MADEHSRRDFVKLSMAAGVPLTLAASPQPALVQRGGLHHRFHPGRSHERGAEHPRPIHPGLHHTDRGAVAWPDSPEKKDLDEFIVLERF